MSTDAREKRIIELARVVADRHVEQNMTCTASCPVHKIAVEFYNIDREAAQ